MTRTIKGMLTNPILRKRVTEMIPNVTLSLTDAEGEQVLIAAESVVITKHKQFGVDTPVKSTIRVNGVQQVHVRETVDEIRIQMLRPAYDTAIANDGPDQS